MRTSCLDIDFASQMKLTKLSFETDYSQDWNNDLCSCHFYRPQRSCGQGYVFTSVCDSVHRGGVSGRENPPARETPPGRENPPSRQTPPWQGGPPPGRETPLARRPPRQGEPPQQGDPPWQGGPPPGRETPLAGRPPWQGDPPGRETPLAGTTPSRQGDTPPRHTVNERPVRILLECILVIQISSLKTRELEDGWKNQTYQGTSNLLKTNRWKGKKPKNGQQYKPVCSGLI